MLTLALTSELRVDIELVRPGQLVRVLDRAFEPAAARRLPEFLAHAAEAKCPELDVPGNVDDTARFSLEVDHSIEDTVLLTASVAGGDGGSPSAVAGVELQMSREALQRAATEARWWLR